MRTSKEAILAATIIAKNIAIAKLQPSKEDTRDLAVAFLSIVEFEKRDNEGND